MTIYGYCRISTRQQNIERQVRNIKEAYPDAVIVKEAYTGTKLEGRKELLKIFSKVKEGDTIIFDSVSRMSRNALEGFETYQTLYSMGVNLVFLKEAYINTEVYKKALENNIEMTGTTVDIILDAINKYLMELAKQQIIVAFEQAQKEVDDLHQRTSEGMKTAKLNGKRIGNEKGVKLTTKKSVEMKEKIKKLSKDFEGTNTDAEVLKILGIARNTYYKYKRELKGEN